MESRCAQGATAAQNQCRDLSICGAVFPSKLEDLLSLCDPNCFGFVGQCKRFFFVNLDFVGDDVFGLRDFFGSQELLGTGAARSTLSVVVPLDINSHWIPHCCPVHL